MSRGGECLRLLLQQEMVSVDARDNDGRTPLHDAAFAGKHECVLALIRHGLESLLL